MAFQKAQEKIGTFDGPIDHFMKLMEKFKDQPPDDWDCSAYDWDKKPQPPDMDYGLANQEEQGSDMSGEN